MLRAMTKLPLPRVVTNPYAIARLARWVSAGAVVWLALVVGLVALAR